MEIAILVGQILVKYGPSVAEAYQKLLAKGSEVTTEEWTAFWALAKKLSESYYAPQVAP